MVFDVSSFGFRVLLNVTIQIIFRNFYLFYLKLMPSKRLPCNDFQRHEDGVVSVGFAEVEPADRCIQVGKACQSQKTFTF